MQQLSPTVSICLWQILCAISRLFDIWLQLKSQRSIPLRKFFKYQGDQLFSVDICNFDTKENKIWENYESKQKNANARIQKLTLNFIHTRAMMILFFSLFFNAIIRAFMCASTYMINCVHIQKPKCSVH